MQRRLAGTFSSSSSPRYRDEELLLKLLLRVAAKRWRSENRARNSGALSKSSPKASPSEQPSSSPSFLSLFSSRQTPCHMRPKETTWWVCVCVCVCEHVCVERDRRAASFRLCNTPSRDVTIYFCVCVCHSCVCELLLKRNPM